MPPGVATGEFALGAGVLALALLFGGRTPRPLERFADAPPPPAGAAVDGLTRAVRDALFPSTIGVTVLAAAALALDARLAALLAGALAGMGTASLANGAQLVWWQRRHGLRLLTGPGGEVFAVRRPS